MNSEDIEAQDDEMLALGSIMDSEIFSIHSGPTKSGQIQISLVLPAKFYLQTDGSCTTSTKDLKDSDSDPVLNTKRFTVSHLPPLTLYFTLPPDYPSTSKPSFTLASCWMDRSALSALCKRLDEIWDNYSGMAILFTWYSFLKEEALDILGLKDTYDISWWYTSGPNATSTSCASDVGYEPESSKNNCQNTRVRLRVGLPKTCDNSSSKGGSDHKSYLDDGNLHEELSSTASSSKSPMCSQNMVEFQSADAENIPNNNGGSRHRVRRKKPGANGEAVVTWLNEAESGALPVSSNSNPCPSPGVEQGHHPVKQGRILDIRAVFDWQSFNSITDYLAYFNTEKTEQEFKTTSQTCDICYMEKFGMDCIRFDCSDIFCKDCVKHFFEGHITNGSIDSVRCPGYECKFTPTPDQIRHIVGEELFERYDRLLLTRSLDSMSDVTFCPRAKCRYPAVRETNEKIASCSACSYVFCPVCLMVYHGVEPCRFKSDDKKEVYETYTSGTSDDKKRLEKIYGKKQLSLLVETVMSEKWVNQKSKPCPSCSAPIEKFEGCNKVTCFKCNTYFCWICSAQLNKLNPYFHFNDPNSKCFNNLFEGANDDDQDEDEEFEEAYFSDDSEFY